MKLIRNLKIRDQLLLLLFLLLTPLVYFVVVQIQQKIEENNELQQVITELTESGEISKFIHQFQKERARIMAGAAGDSIFRLEAIAQRELTNAAIRDLEDFQENSGRSFSGISLLNDLRRFRNHLDQDKLDQPEFRDYSRDLIFNFLNRLDENATGISNVQLSRELQSFRNLTEAKVHLARIRSLMMVVIRRGSFTYEDYALFSSQKNSYAQSLNSFRRYAARESIQEVRDLVSNPHYKEISGIFQLLENSPETVLAQDDPVRIFNLFTQSIDGLRAAEDHMISRIRNQVEEESREKESALFVLIAGLLLALGMAILLSFYIINLISTSLYRLKVAADKIKLGSTDVEINADGSQEIETVADSFRGVVSKNLALTRVAQAIGEGRYDVEVEAQSPEDRLSFAIRDMKESLYSYTTQSQNRSWILTGISELNNLVTGEGATEKVTEKVISFLCAYSGSDAGVLYLHDDAGQLTPAATCGIQYTVGELSSFKIGTGQVGQAVSEGKTRIIEEVEAEYLNIKSSLAEIAPSTVIIIPLQFSATIVGAVELCARQSYSELQQEFLKAACERISIVFNTLQAHIKTQELLYETQNQAEELESQQEELREMNAELKASEEELKVSQEELQEKNSELEEKAQLLEEQYEALRNKNEALEDAREAIELKIQQVEAVSKYKSDFLANMSHELRTPLNSILILSRLLADNPEKTLNAKQTEHARIIHKSGADLLKLINEILDLSKIESGMIRLEMEEVKLDELDLEATFKEIANNKKIDFNVQLHTNGIGSIYTDRFRLEQILKNFLGNAFKFTEEGGKVTFSVQPVNDKSRFKSESLREAPNVIAFSVRDTGIGIPEEKQEAIFEAFQQADSSTTRKYGGTGLGLAISRELAILLGGEIGLESKAGEGSTFTLYLPKKPAGAVKEASPEKAKEKGTGPDKVESVSHVFHRLDAEEKDGVSVLIVEDDRGFNDILADFARAKNFNVRQAFTGKEGLALAREIKPDAVMLDIHLPDITGWDVLRAIRENKELRHINVHIMSAYDKEVVGNFGENEDYLPKPVTLEMLNTAFTTISQISEGSLEKVLIVEDNEIENKAIAELLQAHSIKSISAHSAEEAEQMLARHKIDGIILDLNLPGMKGDAWMSKIRSAKGLSKIPIIIYSGKEVSEEEEKKLKKYANTIIIKNEYSYLRLLDEVQLFLHKVNQKLPMGDDFKMKLHVPEQILKNKKVLLVDDDIRNVYSLSNLLEPQGMNIVEAYDGKEALKKLREEEGIDIILMDIMMPEMDGIEATREIRKMDGFKDLPIIALTAKAMKEDREKCLEAGASDYIPKPVDTEKLLTLMRVWLYEA